MKIIQVTPLYPPHLGGMEQRVRYLSEHLAKKGHQVEVFTSDIVGYKKEDKLKDKKNIKIHYIRNFRRSDNPIIIPSLFLNLMRISKDSIIHLHVAQAIFPEVVYLISKIKGLPYIAHIRLDSSPSTFIGKIFLNIYKRFILKNVLKNSDRIIVLTDDYKELINKKYHINKSKIIIIPNGNSFRIFKQNKKDSYETKILFVGSLSYSKNIPLLLESFNKVHLKAKDICLDIIGEGEDKELIEKYIKNNNLKNKVFLKGRLEGKKLEEAYRNADIFLSTTRQETFGAVYLEAMASGLPIITSNVPGVRNVVKNGYNGILCEQTPEAFAEAIDKLIKNPKLREKLARNGLKEVKKYSWDKILEQTEKVYEEVLKEHNKKLKQKKK